MANFNLKQKNIPVQPFGFFNGQRGVLTSITLIMKTFIYSAKSMMTLLLGVVFLMTSCEKDVKNDPLKTDGHQAEATSDISVEDLTLEFEKAIEGRVNFSEATTDRAPFLINSGFPCELELPQNTRDQSNTDRNEDSKVSPCKKCDCNGLFAEMDLTDAQKGRLRRAMSAYEDCVGNARKRLASMYETLMDEYNAEYNRLAHAHRSGRISKEEFDRMVHRLRSSYEQRFNALKDRNMLCQAISRCHAQYLRHVRATLNARQWHQFAKCQRSCLSNNDRKQDDSGRK
jgi:hypothetical protein